MGGAALTASGPGATSPATPARPAPPPTPVAPSGNLGRLSFGFLLVAVVSGVALSSLYRAGDPLGSVEEIEGAIPWGFFLRALHAVSSWGLLAATAGHLWQVVAKRTEARLPAAVWWRSVLLLPLAVAALLGGFVLRGDAGAVAALEVWRRILESVPFAGPELARLLLGASPPDLGAVLLHHAGAFTLLLWLLTAEHAGRLLPDSRPAVLATLVSVALAGTFPIGLGAPPGAIAPGDRAPLLLGPWYLLGLQGMLVDLPAAAGWLAPLVFVLLLGLLRHAPQRPRAAVVVALLAALAAYGAFAVRLLLLARR